MNRTTLAIAVTLSLGMSLSACTNTALEGDVRRLQSGLNDVRGFQAEQTTKISSLETELRQLSGRLEELEYAQSKKLGTDLTDLRNDLTNLKKRVPPPPIVPVEVLESDEGSLDALPSELAPLVRDGFQGLREGKFNEAESYLKEALELSRGTKWAGDIPWVGVAQDGASNHREALQSYHAVIADFPKHRKAPLTLLRQASIFVRLGDSKTAKLTLQKLIADFPKSVEAVRAKEKLKDL